MAELRSQKQQREYLVRSLRAEGKSWVEVAEVVRRRYRVNARVALRYAHGWSQRQVADEWNRRWPDELKTFKSFSYWELWPSDTGHAPSFGNLSRLSGHAGLITWVYSTRAMIASWWGTADNVLHHAQCSRSAGQSGVGAIRLAGLEARALAHRGNHQQAVELIRTSQDELEKLSDVDSLRDLGEVFTFSRARQHYYNAATLAHMYDWEAVESEASSAINLYDNPTAGQLWPVTMTLSRVYLAQARLINDGPEGAQDALLPVFSIPAEQRIPQTVQALNRLRVPLHSKSYSGLPVTRDLDEAICTFSPAPTRQERS